MTAVLHPVGPQPPRVYWARRLVLVLGLVLVVAVAWALLTGTRSGGEESAAPADEGAGETVADQAAEGEPAPVGDTGPAPCTPTELAATVTTATRAFGADEQPVFAVGLTNTGAGACTVDAGDAAREIVVTSGTDRIWSSLDCPVAAEPRMLLLEPGARDEVQVTWPRVRSAPGCPTDLPAPRPGTYGAVLTVLGATSAAAVFDLD